jgi:hypothetical protein
VKNAEYWRALLRASRKGKNADESGLDALRLRGKGSYPDRDFLEALPMSWVTPTFVEIDMSAEIGSYQDDFDGI